MNKTLWQARLRALIYHVPSPTTLTFFAGLFAGAGINILTSAATEQFPSPMRQVAVSDAVLWVVAAGFLVAAAQRLEAAEREAARYADPHLGPAERHEVRKSMIDRVAGSTAVLFGLAVLSLIAAVLLLVVLLT